MHEQRAAATASRETLVNAYDNSIAYTDHVLAQTIDWLQRAAAATTPALLYVSDHGESLGENNLYLHGLPYAIAPREQKHVPMVAVARRLPMRDGSTRPACARGATRRCRHDHLFHTVLGLLACSRRVPARARRLRACQ